MKIIKPKYFSHLFLHKYNNHKYNNWSIPIQVLQPLLSKQNIYCKPPEILDSVPLIYTAL